MLQNFALRHLEMWRDEIPLADDGSGWEKFALGKLHARLFGIYVPVFFARFLMRGAKR